eukprot:Amastigsp_a676426_198.p3 type:complete len:155 gc:universal Amastigsp_a676426_198:1416-952(-)
MPRRLVTSFSLTAFAQATSPLCRATKLRRIWSGTLPSTRRAVSLVASMGLCFTRRHRREASKCSSTAAASVTSPTTRSSKRRRLLRRTRAETPWSWLGSTVCLSCEVKDRLWRCVVSCSKVAELRGPHLEMQGAMPCGTENAARLSPLAAVTMQ